MKNPTSNTQHSGMLRVLMLGICLAMVAMGVIGVMRVRGQSADATPNFYFVTHPDWPPAPFDMDPSLPMATNSDGSVLVDDTWLELGQELLSSPSFRTASFSEIVPPGTGDTNHQWVVIPPHVYPDFKLNTNILAGRTQSIAIMRSFLSRLPTNSAYLSNRNAAINHQLDWLATQPQQTMTNHYTITTNR